MLLWEIFLKTIWETFATWGKFMPSQLYKESKNRWDFMFQLKKNRKMKLEIASLRKIYKRKEEINNTKKTW